MDHKAMWEALKKQVTEKMESYQFDTETHTRVEGSQSEIICREILDSMFKIEKRMAEFSTDLSKSSLEDLGVIHELGSTVRDPFTGENDITVTENGYKKM